MSLRSPLSRVLGLGTAKEGAGHWWAQRLTAVALIPLTLWFAFSVVTLGSYSYDVVYAWVAQPLSTVLLLLLILSLSYHSHLGVQVVIEDYVHQHGGKLVALVSSSFAHVVIAVTAAVAVLKIGFGGVP